MRAAAPGWHEAKRLSEVSIARAFVDLSRREISCSSVAAVLAIGPNRPGQHGPVRARTPSSARHATFSPLLIKTSILAKSGAMLRVRRSSRESGKARGVHGHEAVATAAVNGSLPHLRSTVREAATNREEKLLPLFYHHLDPTKIPSEDAMDTEILAAETVDTITRALLCVEGLYHFSLSTFPSGSHPDLFGRVWPWAQFLDVHRSRISGAPTEDLLRTRVFSILVSFEGIASKVASTPEIGILAAQVWGNYFRDPNPMSELALRRLAYFLAMGMAAQYGLDPFIEGAGSVDALAILVVNLVHYLLKSDASDPEIKTPHLLAVTIFSNRSKEHAWLSALRSHKFMPVLISVLLFAGRLIENPTEKLYYIYKEAWQGFFRLFALASGYTDVVAVVDAGLLQGIVSIASTRIEWDESRAAAQSPSGEIIKFIVQPATVYYPVLAALERALPLAQQGMSASTFISSPDWEEFINLVLDRLKVKKQFDSGEHIACRACDNLECGQILKRTDFKRCSGCEHQYYCSKECQIQDWRTDGGHVVQLDGPAYLTRRDRAFIRFLVAYDYERHKQHIFLTRIVKINQHGESLLTFFDYREGSLQVDVQPMHSEDKEQDYFRWLLPIRSSASHAHDALVELSQGVSSEMRSASDLHLAIHQTVTELVDTRYLAGCCDGIFREVGHEINSVKDTRRHFGEIYSTLKSRITMLRAVRRKLGIEEMDRVRVGK
ncbi:hypothetical protein C8R45DRAFT_1133106 [Mycena sanguinolenta]|nr:hypothetical protein C8R45DRAFT_1133106 [Mycena sanguinolenta]